MWHSADIARIALDALVEQDTLLAREQAVEGVDAFDELRIHDVLTHAYATAGLGVFRERLYPSESLKGRHRDSDRLRCDLVLTHDPDAVILDPVYETRQAKAAVGTLFHNLTPAAHGLTPADAFWLEVKVVGQFQCARGIPGANTSYGSQLVRSLRDDLKKLAAESALGPAGVLLVLFTERPEVGEHDARAALSRVIGKGVRAGSPTILSAPIVDRMGNASVTLALVPTWSV